MASMSLTRGAPDLEPPDSVPSDFEEVLFFLLLLLLHAGADAGGLEMTGGLEGEGMNNEENQCG